MHGVRKIQARTVIWGVFEVMKRGSGGARIDLHHNSHTKLFLGCAFFGKMSLTG